MSNFFNLFESAHVKTHRKAAEAAAVIRQAAARDLGIEVDILLRFFNAAGTAQMRAYNIGNHGLSGKYLDVMQTPRELLVRIERVTPEIETEILSRRKGAQSATDWEQLTQFEIEIRDAFVTMKETVKQSITVLAQWNSQPARQSRGEA